MVRGIAGFAAVVAIAVAVIAPGIGLLAAWRWSHTRAQPPPPTAPAFVSSTVDEMPVTAMRRLGPAVVWDRSDAAARALAADLQSFGDSVQCSTLLVDGATVAASDPDAVIDIGAAHGAVLGAVAHEVLGPDHRFVTEIRGNPVVAGVHSGDLFLVGGGDPVLVTADFPAQWGTSLLPVTDFDELLDQLTEQGLTTVTGDLVGDARRYDAEFSIATWQREGRVAPHAALLVNRGVLFGASYGLNPVQSAVNEMNRQLTVRGITVEGRNRSIDSAPDGGDRPEDSVVLASVESVPLEEIVSALIETGDATIAELLLKEVGLAGGGSGTRAAGLEVVAATVRAWDPTAQIDLIDGSGRSPGSTADCAAIAQALDRLQRAGVLDGAPLSRADGSDLDAIAVGSGSTAVTAVIAGAGDGSAARRAIEQYARLLASIDELAERVVEPTG